MKKIYSFIALMLMCFVGTANAQVAWEIASESVAEEDFVADADHYYVLQEGDNTQTDQDGKDFTDGHSKNYFMVNNNGSVRMNQTHTNESIVRFYEVGVNSSDYPIYVMQSVATGKYFTKEGFTSDTKAQAYAFSIRLGIAVDEKGVENGEGATWEMYSNIVSMTRSKYAEPNGAWVLCDAESKVYIGFIGDGFSFKSWIDTNNWYIKVATQVDVPAETQFQEFFTKYFSLGFNEALFPVGDQPGCISREFYDEFYEEYLKAADLLNEEASDEAYLAAIQTLQGYLDRYENEVVKVTPGYYVFKNVSRRGILTLTGDNKNARGNNLGMNKSEDYDAWTPASVESWNLNNAKLIWKVEDAKEEGKILLKNFGSQQYLTYNTKPEGYAMVDEESIGFTAKAVKGIEHTLTFGENGMVHVANYDENKLLNFNDPNDDASRWIVYPMSQEVIDTMLTKVDQSAMNQKLQALVDQAGKDVAGIKYENGFIEDAFYNFPADSGLVTRFMEVNSFATNEDKKKCTKEAPFDGIADTYFHTAWGAQDVADQGTVGSHWVKFDLGTGVSHLVIKFSKRKGAVNSHINSYSLSTIADETELTDPKTVWSKQLAKSADSIMYQFGDSTTHIAHYDFKEKVRYILFDVTSTRGKHVAKWDEKTAGTGPYWHCSEMRLYDADSCVVNPQFEMVDKDIQARVDNALAQAKKELKERKAQKATYDELEAALKAYWENFPDPSSLLDALEVAQEMIDKAVVGPGMAEFEEGAPQALQEVVTAISKAIDGKALTYAEIKKYEKQLDEAVALFNSKLNVPKPGKFYRMQCVKPFAPTQAGEHIQWGSYVYANSTDLAGQAHWGYNRDSDIGYRYNTLWLAEKTEKGFAFKNVANGLYLNNPYDGLTEEEYDKVESAVVAFSKEPKYFTLEAATTGKGAFLITFKKNSFLNFDPNGNVVHYYDRNDDHALFTFVEGTQKNVETSGIVDITSGKTQIVSFPFEVDAVVPEGVELYQVEGRQDDKIVLSPLPDEGLAAGTPFVVTSELALGEDSKPVVYPLIFDFAIVDYTELAALDYDYTPKVVNGLVSTLLGIRPTAGYGYIVNNTVIPTTDDVKIPGGTGFFNNSLPAYEGEDTGAFIPAEGIISGEGTAIENVTVVKNVASDVYTISGVKVRQNVKAGVATKGLPKGVYIVGGKKVIVK